MKPMGHVHGIIEVVVEDLYDRYPELLERYGERGRQKCFEDNEHHFRYLETSYSLNNVTLFTDYALWLNGILNRHGMDNKHLIENFDAISRAIKGKLDKNTTEAYLYYLQEGKRVLQQ